MMEKSRHYMKYRCFNLCSDVSKPANFIDIIFYLFMSSSLLNISLQLFEILEYIFLGTFSEKNC